MKFLITGDLQCHKWKQFSCTLKNGMNSRLANCLRVFDILLEEAKRDGIKRVVLNGDIFEDTTYIDVEVYDSVYRKLETLYSNGLEVVINLGNHDISMVHGQFGRRVLHSLRAFRKVALVVEKPTLVWDHLFVVPWNSSASSIKEAIQSAPASKETCLILHYGVRGARVGPNAYHLRSGIGLEELRRKEFGLVILSDYHTRQRLAKNVWYLGSPLQHSFGEIHRPCIWRVGLDREGIFTTKRIYTNLPQFRRIEANSVSELRENTSQYSRKDYFRIEQTNGRLTEGGARRVLGMECQIQISNTSKVETASDIDFRIGEQSATRRALRKYVRKEVAGRTKQKRLLNLGEKLYEGEL